LLKKGPVEVVTPVPRLTVPPERLVKALVAPVVEATPAFKKIEPPFVTVLAKVSRPLLVEMAPPESLFTTAPVTRMWPVVEETLPVEVNVPVRSRLPEVEVTVVPEPTVEAPVTERLEAFNSREFEPSVTNAPPIVVELVMVTVVPPLLFTNTSK